MLRNAEDFGRLIRERRRAEGLTQDQLAARCGVARRFIVELEGGKSTCQLGKALTAALELGVHLGDLAAVEGKRSQADEDRDDPLGALPRF
ncbi:helix-turn-helix domain-containing protein [Rhodoblastus sp. 17X3]|uniref:helix-turn-helix domain-containing protein n=1 Tax=Rhodoblastus sp. 17X3 TaxID=3047026 RepID=UPI0024B73CED|nr:helix-turn-helix domain-containing protein [Rhodoblastus sp. 17X3]MDI9849509.1 helix-turn-helix domain-containing protein [Rhodoblastus sp. 17X3]